MIPVSKPLKKIKKTYTPAATPVKKYAEKPKLSPIKIKKP